MVNNKQTEILDLLENIFLNKVSVKKDWVLIQNQFNKIHPTFFIDFLKKGIQLSSAEERYLLLDKIGMNTQHIATALEVLPESVYTLRYRLRKKINKFPINTFH